MKNLVRLVVIILVAACCTVVIAPPAIAQSAQSYWVFDGRSLSVVQRDPTTVQAKEWAAFYFRKSAPAGTMSQRWGIDTGGSASDVLRKVKKNQRFERLYEKWCQCSWGSNTFFNVVAPIALSEQTRGTRLEAEPGSPLNTSHLDTFHKVVDEVLKYRDIFNNAATMAGEQKLPALSGPFAEFMKNLHNALDRAMSLYAAMEDYHGGALDQIQRTFNELVAASSNVHDNGEAALRLLSSGTSTATAIDARIFGKWSPERYGNPLELRREGDQIMLVIYNNRGEVVQTFSGKAVLKRNGDLDRTPLKPVAAGPYSGCEIDYVDIVNWKMSFGCVDARDPSSGTGWTAIKDR